MNKKLYHCYRCNETFWYNQATAYILKCPSCGNQKVSQKELTLDLQNKSMTLQNVIHGTKDSGIVRINVIGGRQKALFLCNKCQLSFEADCTAGIHSVVCPQCKYKNSDKNDKTIEIKSPIVSVIAGVKGIPTFNRKLSKQEIKKMRFVKNCYAKQVEFEAVLNRISNMLEVLCFPKEFIEEFTRFKDKSVNWLENYHEQKIKDYN